jgi:hypothetical protein
MKGGNGGNNTPTGINALAGDGGNAVILYYPTPSYFSTGDISNSILIGGEGGDNYVGGGPIMGGPGRGGNGLYSSQSTGTCTSSDIIGGQGGDNYGSGGGGGSGGYGIGISSSLSWTINGGNITGGKGGDNFDLDGTGGMGESAVFVGGSNNVILNSATSVVGGDGGDADVGIGPGSAAQTTVFLSSSSNVSILGNTIFTGIGGINASSGSFGVNGSYGIYAADLDGLNTIDGNDLTTNNRGGNTYGLRLLDLAISGYATISDNDIYDNNRGIEISNSNDVTIGPINRILNNEVGIYLTSSDVSVGTGNTVGESDYGIYSVNSNPTISGDQIINSSQIGLTLDTVSDAIVEDSSIINSGIWSVLCRGGSSPEFYNSTFNKMSGNGDFYIDQDSHPMTLNTTFDKGSTAILDGASNLTVNWFMHVRVVNLTFDPVNNADVWVNDTFDTNLFFGQTPVDGWIRWNVVTEYVETQSSGKYYYTPHNASAAQGSDYAVESVSMDLSKNVIIVLGGTQFSIPLKKGWNMISVPLNMSDTDLSQVLMDINGNYKAVQWFDAIDSSDKWKHYEESKGGLNDLSNIDRLMGIWLFMKTDDTLALTGVPPTPATTDIELKSGWNFVGYPSLLTRPVGTGGGEAFSGLAGFVDMVHYYNASDPADPWKGWDPGSYSPDDLVQVEAGFGLWIHVTTDTTWSVDW